MNRIAQVTRLHLNKWQTFVLTPIGILAIVIFVSIVIQLAIQRAGVDVASADYQEGARFNSSVAWALPGFLVYYGVQAVATTYPFALALGTTRRNFILGTLISNAIFAAYAAVLMLALLGVELVTGHWFMGAHIFDVVVLGNGNPLILLPTAFVGVLLCLMIGGLFGAIWVRFGAKGPLFLGVALGLALAILVLIIAPNLVEIVSGITRAGLGIAALVAIVLAMAGTWFAMRRASVR
ncbi:hypothetical protein JD292_08730 [Leucobacter sp. CSA2]|uniref:Uncharacterized protein n=1 Tax=Leucobacter edaphi TaxID=2796472 RepID=A0A934QCM0_9MICO|nr:hypothetical protein [Leucobacter edaphi]MBK0422159.1 hypothetical protein [Leucobacter edaphi]